MNTEAGNSRRIILWLLIFVYFTFIYNYGVKLSTLVYTDFPSFYYAARLIFVEKQSPYQENALKTVALNTEPTRPGEPTPTIYPYLYPPPSLLMFYPMARLHVGTARVALLVVNHLALMAIIAMLLVPIAGFKPGELLTILPAFLILYLLLSKGTFNTIELGQVNLIILALLCLAWWGLKSDWPAWAVAIPLGLACIFKVYPVLFLALLVFRKKYLAAILTVAVLIAICALTWVTLPRAIWHEWTHDVLPTGGYLRSPLNVFPPTMSQNIGLAGFTARLFLPVVLLKGHPPISRALIPHLQLGVILTYLMVAAAVLITLAVAYRSTARRELIPGERDRRINLEFSTFLILTFLVAPLAWEHHLMYVTPAVIVALLAVFRDRPRPATSWTPTLVLLIACLLGWPMTIGKLPLPRIPQILAVSLKLYAVIALWIFLLREMLRGEISGQYAVGGRQ
jgi:hypothetical protein